MKTLDLKLAYSSNAGLLHDSRKDVNVLTQSINQLVDKVNELVEVNNKQQEKINYLESMVTSIR